MALVIMGLPEEPSKSLSRIRFIEYVVIFFSSIKWEFRKQCVEPESTNTLKITVFGKSEVVTDRKRALGSKGAEALR